MNERNGIWQDTIQANGLRSRYLDAGEGPLGLLLHGCPDHAWTWTDQISALSDAGYRAVAPFMRGYPPTEIPADGRYDPEVLGGRSGWAGAGRRIRVSLRSRERLGRGGRVCGPGASSGGGPTKRGDRNRSHRDAGPGLEPDRMHTSSTRAPDTFVHREQPERVDRLLLDWLGAESGAVPGAPARHRRSWDEPRAARWVPHTEPDSPPVLKFMSPTDPREPR